MRWAVPCALARPQPQFPHPSGGPGSARLAFVKHFRGVRSWGNQTDVAGQARQGHVSKHSRHAVGSATCSLGCPGEGDGNREHLVTEVDEDTG